MNLWKQLIITGTAIACAAAPLSSVIAADGNAPLKERLAAAISKGQEFLINKQGEEGTWSDGDYPAITSLALFALQQGPKGTKSKAHQRALEKGYKYLLNLAQPNGGIYRIESLMNYNTSLSILALVAADNPDYHRRARNFVTGGQQDYGTLGETDNVLDGGIGYGNSYPHSDMSNTVLALEALYHSRHLVEDTPDAAVNDLDWDAVIQFVQNCQNLPETNKQPWVADDEANKGGFVYFPGSSKAGEVTLSGGRIALRSYGSISYAGLLSFIYADMSPDDARVKAVRTWLSENYTLQENPGMGPQGLYYYYYTMSKALNLANIKLLKTKEGQQIYWARELGAKMLELQHPDGSWFNENSRWWEKDAEMVTAYAINTLQNIHDSL